MAKTAKMELLRALIAECLSAAAEQIFKIAERTMAEYEEEMSCSQWVLDSHRRLLDVAKSHSKDYLQMSAADGRQQLPASISVSWEEPDNSHSESTEDCGNRNTPPHASPASDNDHGDQEILIKEDNDTKRECDVDTPLKVKKLFKCAICFSGFSSKKMMVRHVKKHVESNASSYQCQLCDRYFCHKSEFIVHARIHKGSQPHECQDCEESLDQRESPFIHREKHAEEKPYWRFSDEADAEALLKSMTPAVKMEETPGQEESDMKTFPLTLTPYDRSEFEQESLQPLCLYQIQTVADIDIDFSAALPVQQIKTEPTEAHDGVSDSGDRPLLSVNPGEHGDGGTEPNHPSMKHIRPRRPSGKSSELTAQLEAGTSPKPYKCPCCAKCFSSTKTLIRHVRIHSEDKPYQCHFCGRNFCQKSDLVNHTRIHTGERPYRCQECSKSFAQKGNLVVHMRKHTGEKPYRCQECSCSFGQKSTLDCHMQRHR
ncbi:putative zinc finger protein 569-like [Scophthalmus maximus]|uniref:Putative zinc finger protein 569-like n=1 Tax=Scophthalmus maximus TaxID=52904 RepID=A0A2U9CKV1_SCOMX|nr:putative zinc finger protein 569-like [Scophthalmus maximus]